MKIFHPALIPLSIIVLITGAFMLHAPVKKGPELHVIGTSARVVDGTNIFVVHIGIYTNNTPLEVFNFGTPVKK